MSFQLSSALAQQAFDVAPKLAAPDGSSVEHVGDSMIINGRPVTIDRVVLPLSPAETVRHYRKALDEKSSGKVVSYRLKGDQILARKIGEHFVTVRIQTALNGNSEAWIITTAMLPPPSAAALPSHLALPAGSRVLSNVETVDGGRRAHTIIATADAAVAATQDFVKRSLGEHGFSLVTSDASSLDQTRRVMLFQRGKEDVMVTIADGPKGRTMVLNASGPK
ncbi:MAG TPA: hypothetical protein VM937_00415 [Burkholderiaceae bacterium]|nr:hypothetical protein [Burkholderiaceae bacterium]